MPVFPSRRVRETPFTPGVRAAGAKAFTVYNHMLLPTVFESLEADYAHLKRHVQVWDVACERQVSIKGPDAERLMRLISPRDIGRMQADQCYYVPCVDAAGGMLNDPVAVRRGPDHFWLSLADSDLLLWVLGVATAMDMDVEITEPDVSPLAVQGPRAEALMERVFGSEIHEIRFFRYRMLPFEGREFVVARSGWSKQGGFEIYVEGRAYGMPLWEALFRAGADLNVRAGCPNQIERIEGGLLSYGSDMRRENTPYECGLGRFCNSPDDFIGRKALEREAETGPARRIRPVEIGGAPLGTPTDAWPLLAEGRQVGQVASAAFSPDFEVNVAIGMVERSHWDAGTQLEIETPDGIRPALVRDRFWI